MKKTICLLLTLVLLFGAAAAVAVDSPQLPDTPPEIEEIIEDVQTVYRLTIYYIYLDGSTAAPTYTEQLDAGTEYNVVSPTMQRVCDTLRREREREIRSKAMHSVQLQNELSSYNKSQSDIVSMLKKNQGYIHSEPYKRMRHDVEEVLNRQNKNSVPQPQQIK